MGKEEPSPYLKRPSDAYAKGSESEDIFERLTRAQYMPGDSGINDDGRDIPWLDLDLAQSGQKFVKENRFGVAIAHTFILLHIVAIKPLSTVLDKSGSKS